MARKFKDRKGVTVIHLFNKEWKIGRFNKMKKTGKSHIVITDPDDKEHHVYGKDTALILSDYMVENFFHKIDTAKAKIYILTSIMDERSNWCFDLNALPAKGESVKIVYHNGTIKRIKFTGEFVTSIIKRKHYGNDNKIISDLTMSTKITPVAWKIK